MVRKDRESLEKDAVAKYGDYIATEKIIALDSKLKLFWNECQDLSEIEIARKIEEEDFDSATVLWYRCQGQKEAFMNALLEKSNFINLEQKLKTFAKDYEKILCLQFLENILGAYQRQIHIFEDQRQVLVDHRKDPDTLQETVNEKRREIQELSKRLEIGVQEMYQKYIQEDFLEAMLTDSYRKWDEELVVFRRKRDWKQLELWFQEKMKESAQVSLELSEQMQGIL